ncbi:MAG: glycosyltransferase family 4 protein [Elusimicrobia bacterium]|nr:glycosyltransferase family 4 protein [Elusimicrobiota bacterium]
MKPKVCMLIPSLFSVIGGAEKQCWLLSKELVKKEVEVIILTQKEKKSPFTEIRDGIKIYYLPGLSLPFFPSFGLFCSTLIFLFLNSDKYDIIHVHMATSLSLTAVFAKYGLRKKIILKMGASGRYGEISTSSKGFWRRFKLYCIKKGFDYFIAISKDITKELEEEGFWSNKIVHIPNGVDTEYFYPVKQKEKELIKQKEKLAGKKIFIFSGRFTPQKNLLFLLKTWKEHKVQVKESVLFLVGEGEEEKKLRLFIENEKIRDVFFIKSTSQIRDYYRFSDIFVLPSLAEGISNSLLEAMASGLIVIASKIPANEEIIQNGTNGILVNIDNTKEFSSLLTKVSIHIDSYSKIGITARQTVEARFSISQVTSRYYQLYKKVLDKN